METPAIKPTIGRIVHFVPPNEHAIEANNYAKEVPAIVTNVFGDGALVNLKVFTDGHYDTWRTSVKYSESKDSFSWHWPERE